MKCMNKKILVLMLVLILIGGGCFWIYKVNKDKVDTEAALQQNQTTNSNQPGKSAALILYYSETCSHCQNVEKYMADNKIASKVSINEKEVSANRNNANELVQIAEVCGISQDSIGVPFLWNGKECVTGDQDIIKFLGKY